MGDFWEHPYVNKVYRKINRWKSLYDEAVSGSHGGFRSGSRLGVRTDDDLDKYITSILLGNAYVSEEEIKQEVIPDIFIPDFYIDDLPKHYFKHVDFSKSKINPDLIQFNKPAKIQDEKPKTKPKEEVYVIKEKSIDNINKLERRAIESKIFFDTASYRSRLGRLAKSPIELNNIFESFVINILSKYPVVFLSQNVRPYMIFISYPYFTSPDQLRFQYFNNNVTSYSLSHNFDLGIELKRAGEPFAYQIEDVLKQYISIMLDICMKKYTVSFYDIGILFKLEISGKVSVHLYKNNVFNQTIDFVQLMK
jgi:hypothetical protein